MAAMNAESSNNQNELNTAQSGPNGTQSEAAAPAGEPSRMLIVMPNWVGDVIMATPALRALRDRYPKTHITCLLRSHLCDLLTGGDWVDEMVTWPTRDRDKVQRREGFLGLAGRLREKRFDAVLLMANSFRTALLATLAGVRRRIGYDRDGRGMLLTDRLLPDKDKGKYVPGPMIRYYNGLARFMGCRECPELPILYTTTEDQAAADAAYRAAGVQAGQPVVVLNTGASYGPAKCWLPERFAELADRLVEKHDAAVFFCCGPKEAGIARHVAGLMKHKGTVLDDPLLSLGASKALIGRADLLVTNDTGPRHLAIAQDTPVVTIFGSSDPRWTENSYAAERIVRVHLDCQPCMERHCPLKHHNCMNNVSTEMVHEAAEELLRQKTAVRNG